MAFNENSNKLNSFIFATFFILSSILELSWGLTDQCASVRTGCITQQIQQNQQNIPPCFVMKTYIDCIAKELEIAENSGTCGLIDIAVFKQDAVKEAQTAMPNCPNEMPSLPVYLTSANDCEKELAQCGTFSVNAYREFNTQNLVSSGCRSLESFKDCMSNQVSSCPTTINIAQYIQNELQIYDYTKKCLRSFSPDCRAISQKCTEQQQTNQMNGIPACQYSSQFSYCLANGYENSLQQVGICTDVSRSYYKNQGLKEAETYAENCAGFTIPQYFQGTGCEKEMGVCGIKLILATLESRKSNSMPQMCNYLKEYQSCMNTNTTSCLDKTYLSNNVKIDFDFFQYDINCKNKVFTDAPPAQTTTEAVDPFKNNGNQNNPTDNTDNEENAASTLSSHVACLSTLMALVLSKML